MSISQSRLRKALEFDENSINFEPRLASGWEQLNDKTLQITLKKGIQFTNGEPFDAESVKFSIEVMTKATAYAYMGT